MGLTKRKDSYYVEFPVLDDGKTLTLARGVPGAMLKRWKVGCLNRKEAKNQGAIIKTRLLSGQMPSEQVIRAQSVTFAEWAETYLQLEQVRNIRTYEDRKLKVSNLVAFFGKKPLASITTEDVEAFRAQRVGPKGKAVSVQTINHDHTALTHMLNLARGPRFRFITDNPASHVPKPDPCNERNRIATEEEFARVYAQAAAHFRPVLTIAYSLGTRRGELLQLEWPEVDMKRREFSLKHTKNGEGRVIPMTPDAYAAFCELAKVRRLDTQHVFLYKGKPLKNLRTAFAAACRRAGVTGLRFHDLRHTAATNLRRAGVDTITAMKIVGHKSEQMHRRYNTVTPADLHQAAAKLNTYLTLANSAPTGQNATTCNSRVGA